MVAQVEQKKNGPEETSSDPFGPNPGATRSTARNLRVRATEIVHGDHSSSGVPAPRAKPYERRAVGGVRVGASKTSCEASMSFTPASKCSPTGPTPGLHPSGARSKYHANVIEQVERQRKYGFLFDVDARWIDRKRTHVVGRRVLQRPLVMSPNRIEKRFRMHSAAHDAAFLRRQSQGLDDEHGRCAKAECGNRCNSNDRGAIRSPTNRERSTHLHVVFGPSRKPVEGRDIGTQNHESRGHGRTRIMSGCNGLAKAPHELARHWSDRPFRFEHESKQVFFAGVGGRRRRRIPIRDHALEDTRDASANTGKFGGFTAI